MKTYNLYTGVWYSPSIDQIVLVNELIRMYDGKSLFLNIDRVVDAGDYSVCQDRTDWERIGDI